MFFAVPWAGGRPSRGPARPRLQRSARAAASRAPPPVSFPPHSTRFTVQPNSTHQEVPHNNLRAFDTVESHGPHRSRVVSAPALMGLSGCSTMSRMHTRDQPAFFAGRVHEQYRRALHCVMETHDQRGPFGGFAAGSALRLCAAALLLTASCHCARTIHQPCSARPLCIYDLRLRGGMPKVSAQRQRGNAPELSMYAAAGLCQVTFWAGVGGPCALTEATPISVFDGYALRDRETLMPTMKNQNRPSRTRHRTHCVRVASCVCATRTG